MISREESNGRTRNNEIRFRINYSDSTKGKGNIENGRHSEKQDKVVGEDDSG